MIVSFRYLFLRFFIATSCLLFGLFEVLAAKDAAPPAVTDRVPNRHAGERPQAPASLGSLDDKNGFRNYFFGTGSDEYSDISPMVAPAKTDSEEWFRVTKFEPKLRDSIISSISLVFEQNMLKKIVVDARGKNNALGLMETLTKAFGEGDTPNGLLSSDRIWEGRRVVLYFTIIGEDARASFTSTEVEKKLEQRSKSVPKI